MSGARVLDKGIQKERPFIQVSESKNDDTIEDEVKQENKSDAVALLDVDHTLIGGIDFFTNIYPTKLEFEQSCKVNTTLLAALKKNGIREIYLFTDMNASPSDIFFRFMLVKYLEGEGFHVNGVVTPPDIFIGRASEDLLRKMEERYCDQLNAGNGTLSEQAKKTQYAEQRTIAADLLKQDEEGFAFAPGEMFNVALKAYLGDVNYSRYKSMTCQQLLESDFQSNVTGEFARYICENTRTLHWLKVKVDHLKGLADNAIEGQHSKGLMFKELVVKKNIQKVFYADDHVGAVASVKAQAQTISTVGASILYLPRAEKNKDPAYHDAYYELSDEHYELAAQSAQNVRPGMLVLMDKEGAKTISDKSIKKESTASSTQTSNWKRIGQVFFYGLIFPALFYYAWQGCKSAYHWYRSHFSNGNVRSPLTPNAQSRNLEPHFASAHIDQHEVVTPTDTCQIFVKLRTGKTFPVDVSLDDTVNAISKKVLTQTGQKNAKLRFIFAGKQLEGEHTLRDYHIPKESAGAISIITLNYR